MDYLSADDNENRYKTRSLDLLARCIKYSNMYKYWDNPVANTRLLFDVLLLVSVLFNTPKASKQQIYIVPPIKYCVFIGGLRNPVDFALFYQTQYFCIYKLTVKRRKGAKINTLDLFLIKKNYNIDVFINKFILSEITIYRKHIKQWTSRRQLFQSLSVLAGCHSEICEQFG